MLPSDYLHVENVSSFHDLISVLKVGMLFFSFAMVLHVLCVNGVL